MPITANGTTYSDDQIKSFFAANPDASSVAKQAASMGLNEGQIKQASDIAGKGWSDSDINSFASNNGYNWGGAGGTLQSAPAGTGGAGQPMQFAVNPNVAGGNAQGGSNGMLNGILTTHGGKQVTHQQLVDFAATNPDDSAIFSFMQQHGMSSGDLATGLNNLGLLYNNGNPTSTQVNDPKNGSIYNRLMNDLAYGTTGYGATPGAGSGGFLGTNPLGNQISGGWQPSASGGGGYGTPGATGAPGTATGAPGATGGAGGTGGSGTGSSGSSSVATSGNTGATNWNVTAPQTVVGQLQTLLDPNNQNGIIARARTGALMNMNARGLLNSSLAQTASDDAAYGAALPIAQADAATNAAAGQFNASGQNTFKLNALNQANTMAQLGFNAQTQKDLAQANYLYSNLQNETAQASSIQQWGLNTITAIQSSDLSADAKNAAVAMVTKYLQNSYSIQGDWHNSAAQAIANIFGHSGTAAPETGASAPPAGQQSLINQVNPNAGQPGYL